MSLEQVLRVRVERALGADVWEENPLVTIGLSHAILNLKVCDEDLHKIVRSYVRQLARAVHPDTLKSVDSPELAAERARIMQAFELLDKEEVFLKALSEFKILISDERSESTRLRTALAVSKARINELSTQLASLAQHCRYLQIEKGEIERKKRIDKIEAPRLKYELTMSNEQRMQYLNLLKGRNQEIEKLMCIMRRMQSTTFAQAPGLFRVSRNSAPDQVQPDLVLPFDAKYITVIRFAVKGMLKSKEKKSSDEIRSQHPSAVEHIEKLISKKRELAALEREKTLAKKKSSDPHREQKAENLESDSESDLETGSAYAIQFTLERIPVENGCLLNKAAARIERVLGSLPLEDVAESQFRKIGAAPASLISECLVPFVIPSCLLVTLHTAKRNSQEPKQIQEPCKMRTAINNVSVSDVGFSTGWFIVDVER